VSECNRARYPDLCSGQVLICFGDRYLLQNMDWLEEELGGFEDDYLVFDCPGALVTPLYLFAQPYLSVMSKGQIELYTHHSFLPTLVRNLSRMGIRTSAVYLIDSQFMEDRYKFFRYSSPPNLALTEAALHGSFFMISAGYSQQCQQWSILRFRG
jgi:Conserved hypothetical ATP binding protein